MLCFRDSSDSVETVAGSKLNVWKKQTPQSIEIDWGVHRGAGDGLLSRALSGGVPSALSGLTTVFGMGTGVALTL
jgi:hypothetical protein